MCGIVGVLAGENAAPDLRGPLDLSPLLDLIAHRGPDGAGVWGEALEAGGAISLGHRRLAILDLSSAGAQPMFDQSGDCVLVFNGEIYNFLEVRAELMAGGAVFRSQSDSEVLLEAYKAWGASCLDRLNGMFSFAIWDRRRKRLFAARDRFGEKPFLFVAKDGFFAFGSEFKVLLAMPQVSSRFDELELVRAACRPAAALDVTRQTAFTDVQQLLPGEALEISPGGEPRIWRYYRPSPHGESARLSEADAFAQFRELLTDSVRIRMRSDVPVGSCLSGGLDSSAIVCIARQLLGPQAPYHTFTGEFPGTAADETRFADIVVAHADAKNHRVHPSVDRFLTELPQWIWHNELPTGGGSQFAQWCVFRLAKDQGVTVLLDGQGADELLGGYESYFELYLMALRETGDAARLERDEPAIRARYPGALSPKHRNWRDRLIPFSLRRTLAHVSGKGSNIGFGLQAGLQEIIAQKNARQRQPGFHALTSALAEDSFGGFLTALLRYGDRNSMAHSREVRLPFCDHRLADFTLSLPPHLLMGEVQNKRLLRESMRGVLPEAIRARWNKQGFNPPQDLWFRDPRMIAMTRDLLSSESFRASPYWTPRFWDRLLERAAGGESGLGWTLWAPTVIEAWRRWFKVEKKALSPLGDRAKLAAAEG